MYHNIPMELRERPQWVCWRYEMVNGRQTKVPYAVDGSRRANILDPRTWGTFDQAVMTSRAPVMDGIGFVLTEQDPYTGIDIDDKPENPASDEERVAQVRILEAFQSYTERSVGGNGYHIIIRGKIAGGRDRGHVGVYSTQRYLTFTGDVVRAAPIADYQELLERLIEQMPENGSGVDLLEEDESLTDLDVHNMAMRADNGEKYDMLCKGDWQAMGYTSQSEADLAILSIIAFYTRSNEQVRRLFRYTPLGQREKATQDNAYIDRTLRKIRANQPSPVDLEAARRMAEALVAATCAPPSTVETGPGFLPAPVPVQAAPAPPQGRAPAPPAATLQVRAPAWPPGLVGELAAFFFATAVRPLPETALAAAIGVTAGVAGRSYNISNTGLNQYVLFLGKTGVGKESIAKGIAKIFRAVRPTVPLAEEFMGPSAFASGQGLIKTLDQHPCFVSVLGEFGLTLQAMSDPRAPGAMILLRKVLLDLYGKSGWEDSLRPTAYSDSDKNTKMIHAPSVTLLGESTPETFYDGLDASDISDGLVPRFHIIEYKGERPFKNPNANCAPEPGLVQRFSDLCSVALTTQNNHTCAAVQTSPEALGILDAFDLLCDQHMRTSNHSGEVQLWNRAHLKALKLAALLAVGCNPHYPVISAELASWAVDFTTHGTEQVLKRFSTGDVGQGEAKQVSELRQAVGWYFTASARDLGIYKCKKELQKAGLIPYSYFVTRLSKIAAFHKDRNGAARAIKSAIEQMVAAEMLVQLTPQEASAKYGMRQALYVLGNSW